MTGLVKVILLILGRSGHRFRHLGLVFHRDFQLYLLCQTSISICSELVDELKHELSYLNSRLTPVPAASQTVDKVDLAKAGYSLLYLFVFVCKFIVS